MPRIFLGHHNMALDDLGLLPSFLSDDDPRPAREQFDENYQHGGGWRPNPGFTLSEQLALQFPGDPPLVPIALMVFRDEKIFVYPHSIVCIVQPDGSFEAARMD